MSKEVKTTGKGVVHVLPGEGESLQVGDDTFTLKATTETTGEALLLIEISVPPQGDPPPRHLHHKTDEAFWVLEGEVEFLGGDRTFVAGAGSFVFVPKETVHTFKNVGAATARMLGMALPAGAEAYFREIGRPAGEGAAPPPEPAEVERWITLGSEYDTYFPPPGA